MKRKTAAQLNREIADSLSGRSSHSTKGNAYDDNDDARRFGRYAHDMEQTMLIRLSPKERQ